MLHWVGNRHGAVALSNETVDVDAANWGLALMLPDVYRPRCVHVVREMYI